MISHRFTSPPLWRPQRMRVGYEFNAWAPPSGAGLRGWSAWGEASLRPCRDRGSRVFWMTFEGGPRPRGQSSVGVEAEGSPPELATGALRCFRIFYNVAPLVREDCILWRLVFLHRSLIPGTGDWSVLLSGEAFIYSIAQLKILRGCSHPPPSARKGRVGGAAKRVSLYESLSLYIYIYMFWLYIYIYIYYWATTTLIVVVVVVVAAVVVVVVGVTNPHVSLDMAALQAKVRPSAFRGSCEQSGGSCGETRRRIDILVQLRPISLLRSSLLRLIAWLKLSGKIPMRLGIPPLKLNIMLESNPLESISLVRRLAVVTCHGHSADRGSCGHAGGREKTLLRRRKPLGRWAFTAPNWGLDCSFCR